MFSLMEKLFPICRSITGDGVRETLDIINNYIPLNIQEINTGTKVFDWEIPQEWNVKDAYIKDENGKKIIDFKKSNLHLVSYSIPIKKRFQIDELRKHLFTIPEQPEVIPYVTSYYKKDWGFCLSHNQLLDLKSEYYDVFIDSSFTNGSLTYADLLIKGNSDKEIIFSTNICHPSLANNELSGPVLCTFLAKWLIDNKKNNYSYRFVFIPETIGAISYISKNMKVLKRNVIGGYTVTCVGDPGNFSYLMTPNDNALVDRITTHVLFHSGRKYNIYPFSKRGSDERQYNYPGVDLNIGSLMKSKYHDYPEYHTSADNLQFVKKDEIFDSLEMYKNCIKVFENNLTYSNTSTCEPQLGRRGLYPQHSTKSTAKETEKIMDVLAYSNGKNDLLFIAEKIGSNINELVPIVKKLFKEKLLKETING